MMLVATVPFFTTKLPDILISQKAEQIAVKLETGGYAMLQGSRKNFKAGLWKEALGIESFANADALKEALKCDGMGCILTLDDVAIALPKRRLVVQEDCGTVAAIIADFYLDCSEAFVVERPRESVSLMIDSGAVRMRQARSFTRRFANNKR